MATLFTGLRADAPVKRRVFFSFHFQQDIDRVNQVRNSWRFRREAEREAYGFFDASLWERSKRQGDDALKSLIRDGMANTSVTCVLAGAHTWQRRWVRYEIARSIVKGNGLLTVKIHSLKNLDGYISTDGPDPLGHMGVYRVPDGRLLLAETDLQGQWVPYRDYTQAVSLPPGWEQPGGLTVIPLARYATQYDYAFGDGYQNFGSWVAAAASAAVR
jgi:MTH538 TIR-like domain (DUF1863)